MNLVQIQTLLILLTFPLCVFVYHVHMHVLQIWKF